MEYITRRLAASGFRSGPMPESSKAVKTWQKFLPECDYSKNQE
jgi:hypothetical protein